MSKLKLTLSGCLVLLWVAPWLSAQSVQLFSFEPSVGVEGKINNRLAGFFQISSETQINREELREEEYENGIRNFDFQVGLSTDITTDLSGTASFTFRLREPFDGSMTTELRPTQQITLGRQFSKYRLRQRLRFDERFIQADPAESHRFSLRVRYRLSLDFPLEGDRLDDREFYINANTEFLYTPTDDDAFFYREYRGYTGLGYQLDERHKLELGGTFETARISRELGRENLWLLKMVWAIGL